MTGTTRQRKLRQAVWAGIVGAAGISIGLLATPATSLESIDVPGGVESVAPAEGEAGTVESGAAACPQLTRIKYPFLSCTRDAEGNVTLSSFGTGFASHVHNEDSFVTGDGYWGPDR